MYSQVAGDLAGHAFHLFLCWSEISLIRVRVHLQSAESENSTLFAVLTQIAQHPLLVEFNIGSEPTTCKTDLQIA